MQGCTVQNHANIQMGSIILDGAIIGSCSIVAAGTVVPADFRIPPKQVWIYKLAAVFAGINLILRISCGEVALPNLFGI